jgi:hypothetical protein
LERSVSSPVFNRPGEPRSIRITPLDAVVLQHGRELLAKAAALTEAVERFQAGDGQVDIGTFQRVSDIAWPCYLHRCSGVSGTRCRLQHRVA